MRGDVSDGGDEQKQKEKDAHGVVDVVCRSVVPLLWRQVVKSRFRVSGSDSCVSNRSPTPPPMVDVPKVVPWATWDEWREVRGLLYSPDPGCRQAGCGIAAAWRVRGKVPLSVETTAQLVEVALATSPPQIEQLALGMSVVRFVNGLIEPEQRKQYVEGEEEMTNVTLCAVMYACVGVCVLCCACCCARL